MKLVPIGEFIWGEIGPTHELTCINHQDAVYMTKNPWLRNLHTIKLPAIPNDERTASGECKCPFADLVVKVEDDQPGGDASPEASTAHSE